MVISSFPGLVSLSHTIDIGCLTTCLDGVSFLRRINDAILCLDRNIYGVMCGHISIADGRKRSLVLHFEISYK